MLALRVGLRVGEQGAGRRRDNVAQAPLHCRMKALGPPACAAAAPKHPALQLMGKDYRGVRAAQRGAGGEPTHACTALRRCKQGPRTREPMQPAALCRCSRCRRADAACQSCGCLVRLYFASCANRTAGACLRSTGPQPTMQTASACSQHAPRHVRCRPRGQQRGKRVWVAGVRCVRSLLPVAAGCEHVAERWLQRMKLTPSSSGVRCSQHGSGCRGELEGTRALAASARAHASVARPHNMLEQCRHVERGQVA